MKRKSTALFAALLCLPAAFRPSTRRFHSRAAGRAGRARRQNAETQLQGGGAATAGSGRDHGQTVGVDINSQNHIFVYSRTHPQGIARGGSAAMLWEFDQNGKFVKEWGPHNYAASFAHSVRVDRHDNVWQIDEGSSMVVKYSAGGRAAGAVRADTGGGRLSRADGREAGTGIRGPGATASRTRWTCSMSCTRTARWGPSTVRPMWRGTHKTTCLSPTATATPVSSRIAPGGHWLKTVGTWGTGPNQFNIVHSVAVDPQDNVYAADRNNHRIQVYDDNLNFIRSIIGMGAPWGVCIPRPDDTAASSSSSVPMALRAGCTRSISQREGRGLGSDQPGPR